MIACWGGREFTFEPDSTALLVVDMQRDFLDRRGMAAIEGEDVGQLRKIMPNVAAITEAAREAGLTIIHTREGYSSDLSDVSRLKAERGSVGSAGPLGRFLIRGEAGHNFFDGFTPRGTESVLDKPGFSAFFRTDLDQQLSDDEITHLIICGITTQCCVQSTLRDAVDRGYYCLTVGDACAAFDPEVHAAAVKVIQAEGNLFGWIAETNEVVAGLEQ